MKKEIKEFIDGDECNDYDAILLYIGTLRDEKWFYCSDNEIVQICKFKTETLN